MIILNVLSNKLFLLCIVFLSGLVSFSYAEEAQSVSENEDVSIEVGSVTHQISNKLLPEYTARVEKVQDLGIKSGARYIPRYEAGQGGVGLGGGVVFPLFFQSYTGSISSTNLSVGGSIWFEWDLFLWRALSTGMEIGGMFALSPNSRSLFMAPITAHIKYTFQLYPVEFPVSFAFGANLSSLESDFKADFIVKPKVGITYRLNQNWALGLFTSYWFVVQDYGLTLGTEYSRLGNFIDTTAGFSYVF